MNNAADTLPAAWNAMTVAQRTEVIKRDASMRSKQWAGMAARMAGSTWDQLGPNGQRAVADLNKLPSRGGK